MAKQDIAKLASQAASEHVSSLVEALQADAEVKAGTVYAEVFQTLIDQCGITQEMLEARIRSFVGEEPDSPNKGLFGYSLTGNLLAETARPNMTKEVFCKLIKAVFPDETLSLSKEEKRQLMKNDTAFPIPYSDQEKRKPL